MKLATEKIPSFEEAYEEGEITMKKGYHDSTKDDDNYKTGENHCACEIPITESGASYIRTKIQLENKEIMYYHQKPVYVKHNNGRFVLADPYYKKKTVRETINEALPRGYDLEFTGNTLNASPSNLTWYITSPEKDESIYYSKDGAMKVVGNIEIPRDEQIINNL